MQAYREEIIPQQDDDGFWLKLGLKWMENQKGYKHVIFNIFRIQLNLPNEA